ncbi:hypothetical protein D3C76_1070450 [compost metagenome]
MLAGIYCLLRTTTLPPEIDTAVREDKQTFVTSFHGKRQCAAATAREDYRNVYQRLKLNSLVAHGPQQRKFNGAGDSFGIE